MRDCHPFPKIKGILVLGSPGSGKSYSVYEPLIDQMMSKGYAMCVYDYKYPICF